jgi:hypothetical protein
MAHSGRAVTSDRVIDVARWNRMWKLCPRSFVLFVIDVILDATSLVTWQTPVVRLSMQPCASDAPSEVNKSCSRIGVGVICDTARGGFQVQ